MSSLTKRRALAAFAIAIAIVFAAACADPECPDGFDKVGNVCKRHDAASEAVSAGEGGTSNSPEGGAMALPEAGATSSSSPDASTPGSAGSDASALPSTGGMDAGNANDATVASATPDSGSPEPLVECDNSRPCAAGYSCNANKCVSACAQKQCDPNATCSLMASSAVCTCNSGFISMTATGGNTTCAKDVACQELGCHANATCEVGTDQLRHCVCKNGYTGDGKTCAPVKCDALTITNGTVAGGNSYGDTATYKCNTGYKLNALIGDYTRRCGADMKWTGTSPQCDQVSCGRPPPVVNAMATSTTVGTPGTTASYTCNGGFVSNGTLTITCSNEGSWSTPPTCTNACGNNRIDRNTTPPEECDPTVAPWNVWNCSATCRVQTMYNFCWTASDCTDGQACGLGGCTRFCASATCPATPMGSSTRAMCFGSGSSAYCIASACSSSSPCANGLICDATRGFCRQCLSNDDCPGKQCLTLEGAVASLGALGRCQ